ncbi:hypothetical protein SB4_07095 [Sphingomonas sanguinis]|uniref:NERD domain-containing protein n=1 Tax=Sphingomonas sanguinis TaxID=33051 RepID=A0A147IXG2_9SPHN|nr:hypothetical protein SB4_07095 [Sphingomonas sanguinis]
MDPRLSEETVKQTLEKYDRKKLIAHLASVRLDGEAVDRLVAIMREGGLPLIKHPNPTAHTKRVSCLAAVEHHIESALGTDEADKVRDFMALVERIEQGYRQILAASDASDGAKLDPAVRVSALLESGARESGAHQARLMEVLGEGGVLDGHGLSLPGAREGERIDPEVPVDSAVQSVTMSLLMQGYRQRWFDANGALEIPAPVAVGDAEIEAVHPILYYAQSWRFWEHIEEDTRYFGGDVVRLDANAIPEDWRAQGVEEVWRHDPEWLEWSRIDFAANQRLAQQLGQNYFEVVHSGVAAKATGIAGSAALAPTAFITVEEMHSLWALRQALSIEPTQHCERYFNLTLIEWLRGYSALRALAADTDAAGGIQVMPRRDLIRTLQRLGLAGRAAETFIGHALLCRSSRDLFDTPLIAVEGEQVLLYGPSLAAMIPAQVMLSRLSSLKQSFEIRGKSFEKAMLGLMLAQGLKAVSVEERHGGETYDYDLLIRWDPYVFLFECKSRSLSGGNKVRSYRFLCETNSQISQVKRLVDGLERYPDILDRHLGDGASQLKLVPCVLNALPFAAGEIDGVYFCDASGVGRLFESGQFNNVLASRDRSTIKLPSYRLWAGETIAPEDLMRQLEASPSGGWRSRKCDGRSVSPTWLRACSPRPTVSCATHSPITNGSPRFARRAQHKRRRASPLIRDLAQSGPKLFCDERRTTNDERRTLSSGLNERQLSGSASGTWNDRL